MENGNASQKRNIDIWQQQIPPNDQNKQFYQNHYQPMQHGFDLQREITQPTTPENVHFLRDNNGPYVKIYYSDSNKEYELFDRNQQENLVFMNNMDMFNNYIPNTQTNQMPFQPMMMNNQAPKHPASSHNNNNNNNSVIHHLVTSNLGPGKFEFGTFGGHNSNPTTNASNSTFSTAPLNISIPHLDSSSYNNNINNNIENGASTADSSPIANMTSMQSPIISTSAQDVSSSNNNASSSNSNKKQRIVAEVKPMRMSYSDVVSKNAVPTTSTSIGQTNSASSSPNTTMPINNNNNKGTKVKYTASNSFEKKQQENVDKNRKSPTNPIITNNATNAEVKKNSHPVVVKAEKPIIATTVQNQSQCNNGKKKKQQSKDSVNIKSSKNLNDANAKNQEKYTTDSEDENDYEDENSSMIDSDNDEDNATLSSDYYDIRKNVYQGEHHKVEKIKGSGYNKKNSKQAQSPITLNLATKKIDRGQKRMSGKAAVNRKPKHEFLQKLFASCVEYLYIFVKWLWMLIYDVSYLSFGIIWDRLNWTYQCGLCGVSYIRRELSSNPGKALIVWIKNIWKRFDNKFDKKSKWAFWRWLFKKQSNSDNAKDNYKDGKLPKTAEEAMKSLLNCKEKDAYSILGVSPDCPQEQIKKHYKKIAVLVHPDKNKQAGAEEAFKVLQRSFELIGEPESRKQYDDNLAKALHTEKAFNELNDLLIQLQTKISEAANTIRCSSCCFRHPRKLTGRKPFAARECSTCKIRHAAREGDIWAETTLFGLRWKYLALMEGNVYDITEWALCQRGALSHLQANSCVVQYKIVLGGNQQNQTQAGDKDKERFIKKDTPVHEPQEDFFLNNIYAGQNPQTPHQNARRRFKK
ncbi:hypothetical protein ACKWTF_013019 [Chironomus riparius]